MIRLCVTAAREFSEEDVPSRCVEVIEPESPFGLENGRSYTSISPARDIVKRYSSGALPTITALPNYPILWPVFATLLLAQPLVNRFHC
jgi:hypothetical protein